MHVEEDSYEFSVKGGTTLDKETLRQLLEEEGVTIEIGNVWTNEQKDAAYTDGEVSSDLELWVEGAVDMTVTEDFSISFRSNADNRFTGTVNSGATQTLGKLVIEGGENGSFADNGGDWYILSGDASITVKLNSKSVLTVGYYNPDTVTIKSNGVVKDCTQTGEGAGNYYMSYTAETDGETVTITKAAEALSALYIGTISVSVRTVITQDTTIDFSQYTDTTTNTTAKFQGIEVDATDNANCKVRANGNSVEVSVGVKFKIYCNSGATVNINYYSGYEAEATVGAYDASDGSITITVTKGGYIVSFEITYPEA